jgi:predicted DNA-binding protein (UPF0251 family)
MENLELPPRTKRIIYEIAFIFEIASKSNIEALDYQHVHDIRSSLRGLTPLQHRVLAKELVKSVKNNPLFRWFFGIRVSSLVVCKQLRIEDVAILEHIKLRDSANIDKIAKRLNVSTRTAFRRINEARILISDSLVAILDGKALSSVLMGV